MLACCWHRRAELAGVRPQQPHDAAANDLVTDFNIARSEAVKRRVPVTLCKSQDGATCDADAAGLSVSWIMFVDDADPASSTAPTATARSTPTR